MDRAQYELVNPFLDQEPSEETGLNSHFRSTFAPQEPITPPEATGVLGDRSSAYVQSHRTGSSVETNPYRRSRASSELKPASVTQVRPHTPNSSRKYDYPSPPNSASPRRGRFSGDHRSEAFGSMNQGRPRRSSNPAPPSVHSNQSEIARHRSLREHYPGDKSHGPLAQLRQDDKIAHRAPHLRKKNFQGADLIDRLDNTGMSQYHHEGPFDAASMARNKHIKHSPIAAVRDSTEEALRATPRENIVDAVRKHRPIEGTANIPPGIPDGFGRVLNYTEGTDLQRDELSGGNYRRVPGVVSQRNPASETTSS